VNQGFKGFFRKSLTPNPRTPPAPLRGERWGEGSSIRDLKDLKGFLKIET